MRRVGRWLAVLAAAAVLAGCGGAKQAPAGDGSGRLQVVTSIYPVFAFTRAVGGDLVELVNLVPPGTEPHDWEPSPGDIRRLNDAAVFVYNGAGMEHWVEKTLNSLDNRDLIKVEASQNVALLAGQEQGDGDESGPAGTASDGHDHGEEWDPHVWLDPLAVVQEVEVIREALIQADPAHRAEYEANAAAYVAKLQALDGQFRQELSGCGRRQFFTTHAAFGYLAHRYDLEQHAIMGLSPDAEPAPQELATIVTEARGLGVKHIFFETLASDRLADVVAREIGAETLVLNPFEGLTEEEIAAGKDYLSVMAENLANLKNALECGE